MLSSYQLVNCNHNKLLMQIERLIRYWDESYVGKQNDYENIDKYKYLRYINTLKLILEHYSSSSKSSINLYIYIPSFSLDF